MEYLMTYGWAILVIAIVAALLFALGLFGQSSSNLPEGCTPQTGFICSNPSYTPNGIVLTVGQESGQYYYGDWVFVSSTSEHLDSNGLPENMSFAANMIPIGALTPGQTATVEFTNAQAGDIPTANVLVGQPLTAYVWLGYCTVPNCNIPTSYTRIGTINTKFSGASAFTISQSTTTSSTSSSTTSTSTSSTTTSSTTTISPPIYNPTSYSGTQNVEFSSVTTLSGDIKTTGTVKIDSGVSLTTDSYSIIAGGAFTNAGSIYTGQVGNQAPNCNYCAGGNEPNAYGGGGGGGGGGNSGNGGSTLVAAGGIAPHVNGQYSNGQSAPTESCSTMTSSLSTWYGNTIAQYLDAGGGGSGSSQGGPSSGEYGIYIQAYSFTNTGTIYANATAATAGNAGNGGGGGGVILVDTSSSGSYSSTGTLNVNGGAAGGGSLYGQGGAGGNGVAYACTYSSAPITP